MAYNLSLEKKTLAVAMLCEGSSIRGIEHVTGVHRDTIMRLQSVPVHEVFRGDTVWRGDVEVFNLDGHPKVKRCYGWSCGDPEEFITLLELPPVNSAESAGRIAVSYQVKRGKL